MTASELPTQPPGHKGKAVSNYAIRDGFSSDEPVKTREKSLQNADLADNKYAKPPRRLRHIDLTPQHLQYRFVAHGYRVYYSLSEAFWSVFSFHNQTFNIWTHLLGFLYFVVIMPDLFSELASLNAATTDYVMYGMFLVCAQIQMVTSALYHTFSCVSPWWDDFLLRVDVVGIISMIFGSFTVGMYNAFVCQQEFLAFYLTVVGSILAVAVITSVVPSCTQSDTFRNVILSSAVTFGAIPLLHWYMIAHPEAVTHLGWATVAMFGSYGIGFIFFVTRFPERIFPGTFDYIGTSHQIWHVFVWIAGFAWCEGMREYLRWRHTVDTPLCELVAA